MATYELIVWRGIPTVVEARDEGGVVSKPLSDKFQQLVDSAAIQLGLEGSEAYLEQWGRSAPAERPGGAREVAEAVAEELEARFPTFIGQAFTR
ncbi:MAG: virulence factor [Candidatus Rokubacteria bacterium]|nr:virulence factor [Candidatus Rokubacteria bacterium]MBI3825063.1 virulence factor [Candidatus Rokubacteria bacterium]